VWALAYDVHKVCSWEGKLDVWKGLWLVSAGRWNILMMEVPGLPSSDSWLALLRICYALVSKDTVSTVSITECPIPMAYRFL